MRVSEATLQRVRDYAVAEPSFTVSFAAWDMTREGEAISHHSVRFAVVELLRLRIVKLIEDNGRWGKVYAYDPPAENGRRRRVALPDLDAGLGVGAAAPTRGTVVPHTRHEGPSGKPGRDKARSARGVKVKRARQGT